VSALTAGSGPANRDASTDHHKTDYEKLYRFTAQKEHSTKSDLSKTTTDALSFDVQYIFCHILTTSCFHNIRCHSYSGITRI